MPNVTIVAALLAGMLSFLSPCVLPLVPPYLVYLTGASLERFADKEAAPVVRRQTMVAALLFVLGFATVFVAFGASASAIGALLHAYSYVLGKVAGVIIILMGLHFLGVTRIAFLMQERRLAMQKPVGLWGAYLMGLAFAFGWTPCIGPILGAILAIAGSQGTVARGAGLLAVYSLGLAVPFLLSALAMATMTRFFRFFRNHFRAITFAGGLILVVMGVMLYTNDLTRLNPWANDLGLNLISGV